MKEIPGYIRGGRIIPLITTGFLTLFYIIYFIKNNVKTKISKCFGVKGVHRPPQSQWLPGFPILFEF